MTPYRKGTTVCLDPNIKPNKLTFGPVAKILYQAVGVITKIEHFKPAKRMSYEVKFFGEEPMWFLENEIATIYTK